MLKLKKFLLLLSCIAMHSCGSDDAAEPVVETKGPISGIVNLYSSQGLPTANSEMTINIIGTNYSLETNEQGEYYFPSVPFGTYTLEFIKEGFGTFYKEVEHDKGFRQNGTELVTLSLGRISNTAIYETIPSLDNGDIKILIVTSPVGTPTSPVYVSVFFHDEVTISNTENSGARGPYTFSSGSTSNTITISATQIAEMGFSSGDHLYFRVYGDSFHSNSYTDENNNVVHPNVKNPGSTTMSFVLP